MAQTSVAQFASELKVPPSVLLEQLRAAGVEKKQPEDALSEQEYMPQDAAGERFLELTDYGFEGELRERFERIRRGRGQSV